MKSRSPIFTVALGLVGILIVSIGLIALGSRESRAFPSADSYLPSGSSAFAELLRESGYTVVIEPRTRPRLQPGDTVIAFNPSAPQGRSIVTSEADDDQLETTKDTIDTFVKAGGHLVSFPMAPDFAESSRKLYQSDKLILSATSFPAHVSWDETPTPGTYLDTPSGTHANQLWGTMAKIENQQVSKTPFVMLKPVGKGLEANFANGIVATNRFVDRQQNALVLMNVVSVVAKPHARIVFAEAAFGNAQDPGVLATIGPWALAAWLQILFLGVVVVYTLGKPFGLPEAERRQERGARDLMDAMADTLRRGHMTKLALKIVFEDTNRHLRKLYRGRRDLERNEMESKNMGDLQRALNKLEAAAEIGAPEDMASRMIQDVERLVKEASTRATGPY